jgi:multimeric flavodoxin WrbA
MMPQGKVTDGEKRLETSELNQSRESEMKIAYLLGSPRENGNSAAIANRFCTTAEGLGAEVRKFVLNKLQYRGCQGCMACKGKTDRCVLEDDLTEVLDSIREADVVVLATPIYFWDETSQMKTFLDRTYSYLVPDFMTNPKRSRLDPGKKLVFIQVQGQPDQSMFTDVFPKYDYFFKGHGFSETHLIRACGVRMPTEAASQEEVMKLAETTAQKLCGGA